MIIFTATTFDNISTITGEKYKGDGYYGHGDGLHTVAWSLNGFTGTIKIQGSLSDEPDTTDWFDLRLGSSTLGGYGVDTTGAALDTSVTSVAYTAETNTLSFNFRGNIVWVRAVIENFSAGTVNSIYLK